MGLGIGIKTRVRRNRVRGGFVGLLDQPFASGATAAYSLRLLRAKHSGGLIRSRADDSGTDKGEADVLPLLQPDGSKIIELNSPIENLNSKAQNRLGTNQGGGDKVLADLVDTGGSNFDGFTSNWYEQTANQYDASQGTASQQPKIVDSGSIVKENGRPALDFDGSDDLFSFTLFSSAPSNLSLYYVLGSQTDSFFDNKYQGGEEAGFFLNKSSIQGRYDNSGNFILFNYPNSNEIDQQRLLGIDFSISGLIIGLDGSTVTKSITLPYTFQKTIGIGGGVAGSVISGNLSKGAHQELIIFDSDKSGNRTQIETEINNYYSIY